MGSTRYILEDRCAGNHVELARVQAHPNDERVRVESAIDFAMTMADELGPDLPKWRKEILEDIEEILEQEEERIGRWFRALPTHGRDAYSVPEAPHQGVAWPALKMLGEYISYPGISELFQEASTGFRLVGEIPPGTGWRKLKEQAPREPIPLEELASRNKEVIEKCAGDNPERQAQELLTEILKERTLGRMWGPFQAPEGWAIKTMALPEGLAEEVDQQWPLWKVPTTEKPLIAPAFCNYADRRGWDRSEDPKGGRLEKVTHERGCDGKGQAGVSSRGLHCRRD